jgi:HAD superfamily hydrolase (TIGR01549 family)
MDIRGVFFDLYGTLLIYGDMTAAWSAWLEALHSRLRGLAPAIDRHTLEQRCDGMFARPEPTGGEGDLTLYERRLEELCLGLGCEPGSDELGRMAQTTASAWQRFIDLDPRAVPALSSLKNDLPLALVSNFDHPPHVYTLLGDAGLDALFDIVVVSGEVGVKKPDPAIFSIPLERLGLEPETVAYVGDAPEDVEGATAAGLVPILLDRRSGDTWAEAADYGSTSGGPRSENAARPAATVSSLDEVVTLVLG